MSRLIARWSALDLKRRITVIVTVAVVVLTFSLILRIGTTPDRALLYSGLEPATAGEVIAALDGQGVNYSIAGDSIFVPADQRDMLRLSLAGEGLPGSGTVGYELLDGLSGFSTTSEMFDAAYRRALEGEIARTLKSTRHFRSARIHISPGQNRPFSRVGTATASATLLPASGNISADQATAVRHLIASAVSGLDTKNVAVIDAATGRIVSAQSSSAGASIPRDQESILKERVERLLEARVGLGNAIVEVAVTPVLESEQIFERTIDPDSRIAISTDTEQRRARSTDAAGGQVTVASNLPEGETAGGDRNSESDDNETRERVNYEISEVRREIERAAGGVARLTVAVLINQDQTAGNQIVERSETELEALKSLVASAVGFDAGRGDTITLQAMEFVTPADAVEDASTPFFAAPRISLMPLIQLGVLASVVLALGLFVLRPILTASAPPALVAPPTTDATPQTALSPADQQILPPIDTSPNVDMVDFDIDSALGLAPPDTESGSDGIVEKLSGIVTERESEAVEVLRNWMNEGETA